MTEHLTMFNEAIEAFSRLERLSLGAVMTIPEEDRVHMTTAGLAVATLYGIETSYLSQLAAEEVVHPLILSDNYLETASLAIQRFVLDNDRPFFANDYEYLGITCSSVKNILETGTLI